MTENPIVVFFRQSETQTPLPIAFLSHGESFNPTQEAGEALLIVLDDERGVPTNFQHSNKNRSAPLGVVWHNETGEKKEALKEYGQPTRVAGFSHVPGNQIFYSIKTVLNNECDVKQFVEKWRKVLVQFDLHELAALITYIALVPKERAHNRDAHSRYLEIVGRSVPESVRELIIKYVDDEKYLEAVKAVEQIAADQGA